MRGAWQRSGWATTVLVVSGVLSWSTPAAAQLSFDDVAPRTYAIEERPYRLGHEFNLGFGVLPLDAFYVGAVVDFSYTYHFSDLWAWEIVNVGYSQNFDTPLRSNLEENYRLAPVQGGGTRINLLGSTNLVAKPLFGKLALFNRKLIYSETFFNVGAGPVLKGENWLFSAVVGMGIRFWANNAVSVRFDVRDHLIFFDWVPENALLFMVSASFNSHASEDSGQ